MKFLEIIVRNCLYNRIDYLTPEFTYNIIKLKNAIDQEWNKKTLDTLIRPGLAINQVES